MNQRAMQILIIISVVIIALIVALVFYIRPTVLVSPPIVRDILVEISTDKSEYQKGEIVKIFFTNNSKETMRTYSGNAVFLIERHRLGLLWYPIRQDPYPCSDEPRPPSAVSFTFKPGITEESWNQKEVWCEGKTKRVEQVPSGKYRVESLVGDENGNTRQLYSNEFEIK